MNEHRIPDQSKFQEPDQGEHLLGSLEQTPVNRGRARAWPALRRSLPARLLVLTIAFVMLVEVFIFVPSFARFWVDTLRTHLDRAQIASLALEGTPDNMVSRDLELELLKNAGVHSVVLHRNEARRLMLSDEQPLMVERTVDLRDAMAWDVIVGATDTLLSTGDRPIRVIDTARYDAGTSIEIVTRERPLRRALLSYSWRIFQLSMIISVTTAGLVFLVLNNLLVRPMRKLTRSMIEFRRNPENHDLIMTPSERDDEIGVAEHELSLMQSDLHESLRQKTRLASLGAAVSKVNHDLRNILASSQLVTDRLGQIEDPVVQRLAPKLVSSINRAIDLCTHTLRYGRTREVTPVRQEFDLHALVEDLHAAAIGDQGDSGIEWANDVPRPFPVYADPDQMFRTLMNLLRNASQAMQDYGRIDPTRRKLLAVHSWSENGAYHISVSDSGPGLPPKAQEFLFQPFAGSVRSGGTGLGLAIAHELVSSHGGRIVLVSTGSDGTVFRITIPDVRGKV